MSTAVVASNAESSVFWFSTTSSRSSRRCGSSARSRCEPGITRRQPFSRVEASSATQIVQVASGRIGQ